ncbi:hypothetical protein MNBD_GAMMA25-1021 [hydrothermal vent metagenome]|uniref:Type II secretion system protein GspC N-terminal domain-containing protein n=1 Tax=hydrothermal vent metagenome TaxID=652676 RepID=A0A3B1BLS7_9ZZZZ
MPAATNSLQSITDNPLAQKLLAAFQSPEISQRIALVVNIMLITLIAWLVADLSWQLIPADSPTAETAKTAQYAPASRSEKPSMANVVMLHLLGESKTAAGKKSAGPIKAPDTNLRLSLHGVFASDNPDLSLAIIAEKKGKDKTYRQGDSLPSGVLLHEIYADRVILSRNGKFETLRLIRKQANIKVSRSAALPGSGELHQSDRITQFKKSYKKDPQSLWKQIRISPVMKNGRIEGYRFSHNDRALMKDLGILPQDVITAINGTAVTDTAQLMEMMGSISSMSELNLSLRRNGQMKDITVRFD